MNEEIEVIMAIFRAMYEKRQLQHTHIGQVTEKQKTADENSQVLHQTIQLTRSCLKWI